jgi:hypothetical protein
VQQINSDTVVAPEMWLVFLSQEDAEDFPDTALHAGARDEDADAPSFEALIQAVLNSNVDEIDAVDSLDSALL